MRAVILLSGGVSSWMAGRRYVEQYHDDDVVALFTDTRTEDEGTYRFLRASAENIGVPLVELDQGKDIWGVFYETRMLGSTQRDPCSRVLKREPARKWVDEHCPEGARIVVGIGWDEIHRLDSIERRWQPHIVSAPLTKPPYLDKAQVLAAARDAGLPVPELYDRGAPHANCGGGCVKAGQAHWAWLLREYPERFAEWERKEAEFRAWIGRDVAMLRDRSGGTVRPMPLSELRERIEAGEESDQMVLEWGGCACFA